MAGGTLASRLSGRRPKPNIVLIYADDVGYGDLSCYGATASTRRILTGSPAAAFGSPMRIPSSATCTPSRYSLLTGEYAWRKRGHRSAAGRRGPDYPARPRDAARRCSKQGYRTGAVGKWHLGWAAATWTGIPRSSPARSRSASITPSSCRPPATACPACSWRTSAWSIWIPKDPIRVDYENADRRRADRQDEPRTAQDAPQPRARHGDRQRHLAASDT